MARSAAAKKVAKAASAGAGGKGAGSERKILFPAAMTLVALLGVALIFVARDQRSDLAPKGDPGLDDHWHSAYAIHLCDAVVPLQFPNDSEDDRTGIHTHGDGLIHIHPFVNTVTGQYATLGAFFNETQSVFNDDQFQMPEGEVLDEADNLCNGGSDDGETELRVLKWNSIIAEKPVVFTEDLRNVRLDADGQLFVFAMVAKTMKNEDILRPDPSYLLQYTGLPDDQKPLSEAENGDIGPTLPETKLPFESEEPSDTLPDSSQPSDE